MLKKWILFALLLTSLILFPGVALSREAQPLELSVTIDEKVAGFNLTVVREGKVLLFFQSADIFFRANGSLASLENKLLRVVEMTVTKGKDPFGSFVMHSFLLQDGIGGDYLAALIDIKEYPDDKSVLVFRQRFPSDVRGAASGDSNDIVSSFPSLQFPGVSESNSNPAQTEIGFVHFSGQFAGGQTPQYGVWRGSKNGGTYGGLSGGIDNSGVLALFRRDMNATLVISPLTEFMAASLHVAPSSKSGKGHQVQWGIMGNVDVIPANYEISWIFLASEGGPNRAVRKWGAQARQWHGRDLLQHQRDPTLQYLGYGTANGAFYYYYPGKKRSNYEELMRDIKQYAEKEDIPYQTLELDSWWYYRDDSSDKSGVPVGGVTNWTAMPKVFPNGLSKVFNITKWRVMAHNRYFAPDNVYASNPEKPIGPTEYKGKKFRFVWGKNAGLPADESFWDYFFEINRNWGLSVYLQDWFSITTPAMPQLASNITFGRNWLRQMGNGAKKHNISIQYCMEFPRNVLSALEIPAVTQARASNDYQPQSALFDTNQWRIGESGLWTSAIGVWPSKDSFWTMPTKQDAPHYDKIWKTYERRNRLESVAASMSGGPVQISDRIGYSNKELILRSCMKSGELLRPDTAASPIDSYFAKRAFGPAVWFTYEAIHVTHSTLGIYTFYYVLSVNLKQQEPFAVDDLPWTDAGEPSRRFIYWEADHPEVVEFLTPDQPITLSPSNYSTFQYFSLVPAFGEKVPAAGCWMLQGEVDKWISSSRQRFTELYIDPLDASTNVIVRGSPSEEVHLSFVQTVTLLRIEKDVLIGKNGTAAVRVSSNGDVAVN